MIALSPTRPFGAVVRDLDLTAPPDEGVTDALRDGLAGRGVLVFPGQHALDDVAFCAFLRWFGPLDFTAGETPLPGCPDLNAVSNVGRSVPPRSNFHIDTGYVARPPAYTALRAVTIPHTGGETVFSDQRAALESLPPELRSAVEGRTLRHVATGVTLGPDDEAAAEHPLVRPHPRSGAPVLYLDAPARCGAVSGLDDGAAGRLVEALIAHSTAADRLLRHRWSPGDVLMWDNGVVMHRADHSGVVGDRVMHRGMVAAAGYGS